jgi:hypothetical protein
MVRKGSPVRVRQRASQTALQRGFLVFGPALVTPSSGKGRGRRLNPAEAFPAQSCCGAPLRGAGSARIVDSSLSRVPSGQCSGCGRQSRLVDRVDGTVEIVDEPHVDVVLAPRSAVQTAIDGM